MDTPERVLARYLKAVRVLQSKGFATGLPVPAVKEQPGYCGPAALRSVLAFYGRDVAEDEIAKLAGSDHVKGTPPDNLMQAARKLGMVAESKENATVGDLRKWLDKGVPVIVNWWSTDDGHYSVLKAIRDGKVFMEDPEIAAERSMDLDAFERAWFDFRGDTEQHQGLVQRLMIVVRPG